MLARFEASGERDKLARLHAEHYLSSLRRAEVDWEIKPATEWLSLHRHLIDNVRAALDWSFSPRGDITTGIALTICAVPLWFELSLTSECAERVDRALAACGEQRNADREMRLYAARAWSLMQTRGFVVETEVAWSHVLELSREQGNVDYQLRALWGQWAALLNRCELQAALAVGKQFSELAKTQTGTGDRFVGDRMVGYILHLMGDQTQARQYLERMLEGYETPVAGAQLVRFVFDQRATAQC
ncbi:MAG: transcriptional regulator, partial [Alphaproteobacteria bacterium]